MSRGYWEADLATAQKFRPVPGGAGRELFTGHFGFLDSDGGLHVRGRVDSQLKIRGHRVLPADIENCLLGHAEVVEAAVIGYTSSARDLRSPELDETKPEVRRAFLGDSLTLDKAAGANEATWPHRVCERLSTLLPDVRCDYLNAAVPACKTE